MDRPSRQIRLKRRPTGLPSVDDFELVQVPLVGLAEGQVVVHNEYLSVDPYMRGRMSVRESYASPFPLHAPLNGGCVGRIVESRNGKFKVGDHVLGMQGWRDYYLSDGSDLVTIDLSVGPLQAYLGTLGMPGLTAYVGLLDIGRPKVGETVFVSAAAGAVGTVACQIAKLKGCRVVGSAGSDEKVAWLIDTVGVDAAINYKEADDLVTELRRHCPDGIDIYYENVGGEHLECALELMNLFGRIVLCGLISQYNATEPQAAPRNLAHLLWKRLLLQGFIVSDHDDRRSEFYADMKRWISAGQMRWQETVVEGLENAPSAFIGLFKGENMGKMLVRIDPGSGELGG